MPTTTTAVDVTLVSGPTSPGTVDDWELYFARRALAKLKSALGKERILELFKQDLAASNEILAQWVAASDGTVQPARTHLSVQGLTATEFLQYAHKIMADADEPRLYASHPEHFAFTSSEGGRVRVVENLGHLISDTHITFVDESQAVEEPAADYPHRMVANLALPDGTPFGHALHQFRDTETGFDASLAIYFPSAAPEEFIESHRRHLAVEYANWFIHAGNALGRSYTSVVPVVIPGVDS